MPHAVQRKIRETKLDKHALKTSDKVRPRKVNRDMARDDRTPMFVHIVRTTRRTRIPETIDVKRSITEANRRPCTGEPATVLQEVRRNDSRQRKQRNSRLMQISAGADEYANEVMEWRRDSRGRHLHQLRRWQRLEC